MLLIITFLITLNGAMFIYFKKQRDNKSAMLAQKLNTSEELKTTLAMGLYLRFSFKDKVKLDANGKEVGYTDLFIKQSPLEFEDFVASIFKKNYGGHMYVTRPIGDFGVDFEHQRDDGLFLGQVKGYKDDIIYKDIAILHSNMVKKKAAGGYFITTSSFNENARKYAEGLNIELINGIMLVEAWLESLNQTVYSLNEEFV